MNGNAIPWCERCARLEPPVATKARFRLKGDGGSFCVGCKTILLATEEQVATDFKEIPEAAPAPPLNKEKETPPMAAEKKACSAPGCGTQIFASNKSGYCAKHFHLSKKKGDRRACACGKPLRADNRSGSCTACKKKIGQKAKAPAPAYTVGPVRATIRRVTAVVRSRRVAGDELRPASIGNGVATLTVSEAQLDTMWSRFQLADKVEAIQWWLEQRQ